MKPLESTHLLEALKWRYATKMFDPARTIPAETWRVLEEALILTPSSYGLQPWRFIVVTDVEMKQKLRPHSWNQAQVTDCSHYVIFATLKKISEAEIDKFINHASATQGTPMEKLAGYRGMIVKDVVHGPRGQVAQEWAARQAYIALGNFMTAAALLQVDACPMEGFVPAEYDKILGLAERGLTATVCCAAGYRSPECKYAKAPKVRFSHAEMVEHI